MKSVLYFSLLCLCACTSMKEKEMLEIVSQWEKRQIIIPEDTAFVIYQRFKEDRQVPMSYDKFAVLSYVDSTGCMSCKLQLPEWGKFIYVLDSISHHTIPCLFVFHPKHKEELVSFLKRTGFSYPVFIDTSDSFNRLNQFPEEDAFRTFLIDNDNRVLAMGNPIHNPYVRQLYLDIIQCKEIGRESDRKKELTHVTVADTAVATLPDFPYQEEQHGRFALVNTGDSWLVIQQVTTTCGCLETDYSQAPVLPGDTVCLNYSYKADYPGYFDKVLYVYCNAEESPLRLRVRGTAMD